MRKTLLLPITLLLAFQLTAQIEKPSLKSNYASFGIKGLYSPTYGFEPDLELRYGRFFKDHWLIGVSADLRRTDRFHQESLGLFARYYFSKEQKGLFLEATHKFGRTNQRLIDAFNGDILESRSGSFSESFVGIGYALVNKKNFGVELFTGYQWSSYRFDQDFIRRGGRFQHRGFSTGIRLQYKF